MRRKVLSLFLVCLLMLPLCGCNDTVAEVADNVLDAAREKLKSEVARVLEENKLEVVEIKTTFGNLNDEGSKYQFLVAALVKSNATAIPESAANSLGKIFTQTGLTEQTAADFENPNLIHKDITFKHTDYAEGKYYVIWGYAADLSIDLPDFTGPTQK